MTQVITSNIDKLTQSQKALSVSISANKDGVTAEVTGPNETSASGSVSQDGVSGSAESSKGNVSGSVGNDGISGQADGSGGTSASGSVGQDGASASIQSSRGNGSVSVDATSGFAGDLSVPTSLMETLQQSNEKAIKKLEALQKKVDAADGLADIQATAKEFDEQFKEFAVANVQANVTKAIDSMTRVLDQLQVVASKIQTQVTKIKECARGMESGEGSASGSVSRSNGSGSASLNASAPGCDDLKVDVNSGDAAASLQAKLDEVKSTMQTIRSFLSSSIGLIAQLKDGDFKGTITSFDGISAQIDIVSKMSISVQTTLLNLAAAVAK